MDEEQSVPIFSWSDEVSLHVPDPLSFIDILGSSVNRAFAFDPRAALLSSVFPRQQLLSVNLNLPSIRTLDECPYRDAGDVWKVLVVLPDATRDHLRRLIIQEVVFDDLSEFRMLHNRVWPHPFVILRDPGLVLGVF